MIKPRLFLCNGASISDEDPLAANRKVVLLNVQGSKANVHLQLEDVARIFNEDLSSRLVDFLEIAAYIYAADASTERGTAWADDQTTEPWDRNFHFIIAVRDLSFWCRDDVQKLLVQVLEFLSDGKFAFEFRQLLEEQPKQAYLEFGDQEDWPFHKIDRVLMFSGGLDSLAGAVESASDGKKLMLVSHRPVATLDARQRGLFSELSKAFSVPMIHVPVWVNKDEALGREFTQRTRSFLFAALGTVVAESVKADGVRFFENGVVSLNLPVADEVVRARASRTTHPLALDLLTKLCSLITERDFVIDNPYLFKTKTDIVSIIANRNANQLIQFTCSCAHRFFKSRSQWHCGTCSQCIDRRIAILAAGQEKCEPEYDYASDVFTGPRQDGYEKNMTVDYVRHALELHQMSEEVVASTFNLELTRAVRWLPKRRESAEQLVAMHKRHAAQVCGVLEQQLKQHARKLLNGELSDTSMLALVVGKHHLEPIWQRYCERIGKLLSIGVPKSCMTNKPKDEPHLQEICDGILKAHDENLIREFPFMRWSASLTKPDWSAEALLLWIELKYVRQRSDIRQITEDIAADITKYGDNGRRIFFVVYDPQHLIADDKAFAAPIHQRPTMRIQFIR